MSMHCRNRIARSSRPARDASMLGVEIPPEVATRGSKRSARRSRQRPQSLKVVPPPFRPDVNETADLAEEVARMAGLAEIPATLPLRPAMADTARSGRVNSAAGRGTS